MIETVERWGKRIFLAQPAGFCGGVRRAVRKAEEVAAAGKKVYSLGSLVHNRRVVEDLARRGVTTVQALDQVQEGTVLIRTHGVGPGTFREAAAYGVDVLDATCPYVRISQMRASRYAGEGYWVVVVGKAEHPEVRGVLAWADGKGEAVVNAKAAEALPRREKLAVLAQTTLQRDVYMAALDVLREKADEFVWEDTICSATARRQQAAAELADYCEVVLVVGGKDSANTRHLAEICASRGSTAHLIEGADDIVEGWFRSGQRVGITAGASTPAWIIKEVVAKMEEIEKQLAEQESNDVEGQRSDVAGEREVLAQSDEASSAGATEVSSEHEVQPDPAEETMERALEEEAVDYNSTLMDLHPGQIVQGKVVQIDTDGVLVDVGYKTEGFIPLRELSYRQVSGPGELVSLGDEFEVWVMSINGEEGSLRLSRRRAEEAKGWGRLQELRNSGETIEVPVVEAVKGGLVADVGMRGFIPASQVDLGYVNDLDKYVGQTLSVRVTEVDRGKRRVILSRKVVLEEERARRREDVWGKLDEGQTYRGTVKSLTSFGAFIDLGGVDGLLHISEISWGRVDHPSQVLQEGQEVDVVVLRLDRDKGKISLGMKQALPNPWDDIDQKYGIGSTVIGKVVRLAPFGAFVELEPGVDGLVHISQMADWRVEKPEDVVSVGQQVLVKILRVDPNERRISLSMRGVEATTEEE